MRQSSDREAGTADACGFDSILWDSYAPFFDAEEGSVFPEDSRETGFYRLMRTRFGKGRCLELGAGSGRLTGPLSCESLTAFLEPSRGMLEHWHGKDGRADVIVRGLGQALPFADRSLDLVVFACNGLHCVLGRAERISLLAEAGRVLSPGGWLVLETCPAFGRRPREEAAERYDYCDGRLRLRLVESVGRMEQHGTILFDMTYTHGRGQVTRIALELALIGVGELLEELGEAGLSVLHTWGEYDFSALEDSSPRMLTAAVGKG